MTNNIQRWALLIEFDGTNYVGWQKQKEEISIQQLIEEAALFLTNGQKVQSITSGRTDSGVHATGMVIHIDFPSDIILSEQSIRGAINFHLKPHPIVILKAAQVDIQWNARFSALWREYHYIILNRWARPTIENNYVWHIGPLLNIDDMQKGGNFLLGYHDFSSFRAAACQAHNAMRTLDELKIWKENNKIFIKVRARSFLHHQVRNIVGSLSLVGHGKWSPYKIKEILDLKDRTKAGPTAPPEGLYFTNVKYPIDPFYKETN